MKCSLRTSRNKLIEENDRGKQYLLTAYDPRCHNEHDSMTGEEVFLEKVMLAWKNVFVPAVFAASFQI